MMHGQTNIIFNLKYFEVSEINLVIEETGKIARRRDACWRLKFCRALRHVAWPTITDVST